MGDTRFRTVLIASSFRAGSTALNLSLSRHPQIFGWPHELGFFRGTAGLAAQLRAAGETVGEPSTIMRGLFREFCCASGWGGEPWVVHKDPHDAKHLREAVAWSGASRVLLLVRNPYAIVHSLLEHFFDTVREAAFHVRDFYDHLLRFETSAPELTTRVRYEDLAASPRDTLAGILDMCLGLRLDEACLDLSGAMVPRGLGDHKVQHTAAWHPESIELWRVGLSAEEKRFVRSTSARTIRALGYDPDDTEPGPSWPLR